MPIYRLAEGVNPDGLPFLFEGHAYLADGTPLTKSDRYGRVTPAEETLAFTKATCSGGLIGLADRRSGISALARALDKGDAVRAPLLLLFLQIDPNSVIAKYNPFHKPPGPGGGQFTSGAQAGGGGPGRSDLQPAAQTLGVQYYPDYEYGIHGADIDLAQRLVQTMVALAILKVTTLTFRPGMLGYGQKLHDTLEEEIEAAPKDLNLHINNVYKDGKLLAGKRKPLGSSCPDVIFGPPGHPLAAFEVKSGTAADTSATATRKQREAAMRNLPGPPVYSYFLVREQLK